MTDQRPMSDTPNEELDQPEQPEPTEWSPTVGQSDSSAVAQSNSPVMPEFIPTTFAEARAKVAEVGEAELKGSIFPVVNKELLIGVPMMILNFQWNVDDKTGNEFVSLHVITDKDERWTVNDGGTGIYQQMKQWEHDIPDRKTMIDIPNGLRKSEYTAKWKEVDAKTGEVKNVSGPATTYYFA
jgi:hypothetical protein